MGHSYGSISDAMKIMKIGEKGKASEYIGEIPYIYIYI
jgi:hypothetical protein